MTARRASTHVGTRQSPLTQTREPDVAIVELSTAAAILLPARASLLSSPFDDMALDTSPTTGKGRSQVPDLYTRGDKD